MKILKNRGKFEVLTKPENVVHDIAIAARTCYQSQDKASEENDIKLVKNLMKREHFAMFEFSHLNVRFNDVSRGFTHEMVRHRLSSFAQESTRYVSKSNLQVVVPPHKNEDEIINLEMAPFNTITLREWFQLNQEMYKGLRNKEWKSEDARQVLPIATRSQIVVSANVREWRHIFHMRCDKFAHWEIRSVMLNLLKWCQENIPLVFDDFKFFVTKDSKQYARRIIPSKNIAEQITENGDVESIMNCLSTDIQLKILTHLNDKHWR